MNAGFLLTYLDYLGLSCLQSANLHKVSKNKKVHAKM